MEYSRIEEFTKMNRQLDIALNDNNHLLLRIDQLKHTIRQKDDLIESLILDAKLREDAK